MSERKIEWVSQADLERITGKDRRTISGRIKDLHFKQEGRSKLYDKMLAVQAIVAKSVDPESDAKNRRALAEAEKAELLVARLRGELVPVSDMKRAAAELIKTLYARTVRVTPSILAPQMIGKTDVLEIEGIIRDAVADVFNELKSMPDHFLTVTPDEGDLEELPTEQP
jgi:hypothetical protein